MNVAAGHTLTLDGQADTDTYVVNTNGGDAIDKNYVINVLDTGAKNDGLDTLTVNGTDDDDTFLLRQVTNIGNASNFSLEYAETPAFVALLHGSVDDIFHRANAAVERINYDENINSRLTVNGGAGDDTFATDDNSSITTLDGGAGDDTFLIGQAYTNPRIAPDVAAEDAFPTTFTILGWVSRGISFPTTVYGGTGDDSFLVYSNAPRSSSTAAPATTSSRFAPRRSSTRRPATSSSTRSPRTSGDHDWKSRLRDRPGLHDRRPVNVVGGAGLQPPRHRRQRLRPAARTTGGGAGGTATTIRSTSSTISS